MSTCSKCNYYRPGGGNKKWGKCHRYPPTNKVDSHGDGIVGSYDEFVAVQEEEWCGEFLKSFKVETPTLEEALE